MSQRRTERLRERNAERHSQECELKRDRQVFGAGELPEEVIALIAKSEVPPGYEHLDDELKDWNP